MADTHTQPKAKRARTGVGSSVAELVRSETDDFVLVLTKTKAERLLPKGRHVIVTDTAEDLSQVFKKMVTANVLSLPALNQKRRYYGMVEMWDLVEYVTALLSDLSSTRLVDLEKLLVSEKKFLRATVKDVVKSPFSRNRNHHTLQTGFSLFTAWEILALNGAHRIAVLGGNEEVVDIITPSMLVDFLWQNIEKTGKTANRQIRDFVISPSEELATIKETSRAIVAFRDMVRMEKTGLAIIDDQGKLIDNISPRDLRGIHTEANVFWRLWSTVSEFKARERIEHEKKTPNEPIYVLPMDTLYTVVEKMATQHIHRVYVVDDEKHLRPQRVITQQDVLREILEK